MDSRKGGGEMGIGYRVTMIHDATGACMSTGEDFPWWAARVGARWRLDPCSFQPPPPLLRLRGRPFRACGGPGEKARPGRWVVFSGGEGGGVVRGGLQARGGSWGAEYGTWVPITM